MGYSKVIKYSNTVEIYQYENDLPSVTKQTRAIQTARRNENISLHRENSVEFKKSYEGKRRSSARLAQVAFRRLVSANLGESENPVFVSLTYAKSVEDISVGHKDFNAFARNVRNQFGEHIRYVAVSEFQKRGSIHFHALFWGLPAGVVDTERDTRLVAGLWKQGFVDLKLTDGDEKIAGYMAKYMSKAFVDSRLYGKKAYIASRNILRPYVEKRAVVISHVYEHGLSTVEPLQDSTYLTLWLGECRYRLFKLKQ